MVLRVPRGSSLLRPEALSGHTGLPGRMLSWEGTDESLAWTVRLRHHKVIEWTVAYVAAGFARQGGLKVTPVSVTLMDFGARSIGFAALLAILVCAVTFTVPGCGGKAPTRAQTIERYSQELREAVSANVPEEGRKAQMILIVDEVEALNHRFSRETADFVDSYRKQNADYDSTRQALDQLFSDYSAKRIKARNEALDLHFRLASLATVVEWNAIGKAELKLYEEVNAARSAEESTK